MIVLAVSTADVQTGHADPGKSSQFKKIHLSRVEPDTGRGYGYVLQYYVPVPI
jgi:hypothetical protein